MTGKLRVAPGNGTFGDGLECETDDGGDMVEVEQEIARHGVMESVCAAVRSGSSTRQNMDGE